LEEKKKPKKCFILWRTWLGQFRLTFYPFDDTTSTSVLAQGQFCTLIFPLSISFYPTHSRVISQVLRCVTCRFLDEGIMPCSSQIDRRANLISTKLTRLLS
jgi:hypothetical protein